MDQNKHFDSKYAQAITLNDLSEYVVAPGDIFYQKESGRPIKILDAGQFIEKDKMHKFSTVSEKILINKKINPGNIHVLVEFLKEYKLVKLEKEYWSIRKELLITFADGYWRGIRPCGMLDLVIVGHRSFLKAEEEDLKLLAKMGDDLFLRNSLAAMLGVILAFASGYHAFEVLSDIYHSILLKDWSLKDSGTRNVLAVLEARRVLMIDEKKEANLLPFEKQGCFDHALDAGEIEKEWQKLFIDRAYLNAMSTHHELPSGNGFPKGVNEDEWTELQGLFVLIEHMLPLVIKDLNSDDGKAFLKLFWENEKNSKCFSLRMLKTLHVFFESLPTLEAFYESREVA